MSEGMADAAGVFYNYSRNLSCFDFDSGPNPETTEVADFWGYQYCTEQFQLFSKDGGQFSEVFIACHRLVMTL